MPLKLIFLCSPILLFFFYCLPGNAGDNVEKNVEKKVENSPEGYAEQRETSPLKTPSSLKPFTSVGCSAFPDGTPSQQEVWLSCCTDHDYAYWQGGNSLQRREADQQLRSCVANAGHPDIAKLMLAGVRVGGTPYLPTKFRWAYGWPYPRGYRELSEEEKEQVQQHSEQYRQTLKHPLQQ